MIRNKQTIHLAFLVILVTVLLQFITVNVKAQSDDKNTEAKKKFYHAQDSLKLIGTADSNEEIVNDPTSEESKYNSMMKQSFTNQYVFNVEHQKRTFTQQYFSSIFIFIMVVIIVCMGLVLSYKQFKLNEEIVRHSMKQNNGTIEKGTDTSASMEVSKDGIKMNTAVIGLMILVISLVFFFLYLTYVYPIEIVK